jgi:hypothetical protein
MNRAVRQIAIVSMTFVASTATRSTIQVGRLAVDMYDSATRQLVWRGEVS